MSTSENLQRLALSLEGTTETPHFNRTAFKTRSIYVTLASDGRTASFKFTPEQQALKCTVASEIFSAIPNGWDNRGATTAVLAWLTESDLADALRTAWGTVRQNRRSSHASSSGKGIDRCGPAGHLLKSTRSKQVTIVKNDLTR